ncbi:MAG: RNA polymerase factor sigma-54 [Gammaproteobacteria bacterium]|nr:RNA polymerase factor sigma-54 [Gammaproteobacteria bacterium]
MLKPSLQLRIGQQLTMTPQLQQAIRLLQLPALDLQAHVREALDANVMLEAEDEPTEEPALARGIDPASQEADQAPPHGGSTASGDPAENPASDRPDEMAEDSWSERTVGPSESPWSGDEDRDAEFGDPHQSTLQELLLEQLDLMRLDPQDRAIARMIVDAITDDGYLQDDLDTIRASLLPEVPVAVADVERVLATVQALEPAGIGARSLAECLALQLRQLDPQTPGRDLALQIALEHLDWVASQQLGLLRRHLRCGDAELDAALALVRACHPRPGAAVAGGHAEYVIPDVFVRRSDHGWVVEVNPATVPRVRVNQSYANAISRAPDHAMLRAQLQEARWLLRSLEIRNETLVKVARCIVRRQTRFFERGEEAMVPLILKDVADEVEMHESTISRVTTAKYMHTPRGVFEFRYFFSSHVAAADGTETSSTAIRAKLRKLIGQENPDNPLSDSKLAQILSSEGIPVARRTVAKYREAMRIAPSNERKRAAARDP